MLLEETKQGIIDLLPNVPTWQISRSLQITVLILNCMNMINSSIVVLHPMGPLVHVQMSFGWAETDWDTLVPKNVISSTCICLTC